MLDETESAREYFFVFGQWCLLIMLFYIILLAILAAPTSTLPNVHKVVVLVDSGHREKINFVCPN